MSKPALILIVDDEQLIRLNLRALLEDLGYRVAEAADGREGLAAFDRERPELVLADLMMPVMNGLSMIAGLREKSPETPVIAISGTGAVRDAVDSLRLGAWDYVLKPVVDAEGLDITIKRALEKARLVRENRLYQEHLEELVRARTEELRDREAFLNTVLNAIPIPVFYEDRNGRYLGCNRAFETFFGVPRERLIGKTVFDSIPRDLAESYHARDNELFESGGVQHFESQLKNAQGQLRDVIFNKAVFFDSQGSVSGLVGTILDITERKQVENRLNEQLHFLQQLLDSLPIPVYYKGVDRLYLGCNTAFETFIGLPRKDIVGKTVYEVLPKDHADKHHQADSALHCQTGAQIYEVCGEYKDGEYHNVIFNKATFLDANDRVAGTVGAIMDITSLRKAEEERKLLEAQLHQTQKIEAIGQLAGGIAHDFNNLLTAIIGYAEMIHLRMEKDSPLRHFIEQVLTSADRATELTSGLLAFSRRQVLHTKPMDLCGVVQDFKKMLRRLLPEDIDFKTQLAEGTLIVMADKGQIEQVLMNLVTNAKDAMPRGGTLSIEVSPAVMEERFVHTHGFGEPGSYACVSVTDTGHGMDEETTKRIFEPFFTTKEVGKGTGLGMAILYGIIQQHNGCITVCSKAGKGTIFRIYLPLIVAEITEAHGKREPEQPPGGTETILLVEDDVTVRELHKLIFEGAGYGIIEAVDGQDALDKFIEHTSKVDIVVTDVIMPKMDGKSLYEKISRIRPGMKVLFTSGYAKDVIVERGILDNEFRYVTKPVTSAKLLKLVREILDRN